MYKNVRQKKLSMVRRALSVCTLLFQPALSFALNRASALPTATFIRSFSSHRNTKRRMRIERDGTSNTITFHPTDGTHSGTVVLMHGLGDSGDGLADLAEMWAKKLPHVKFILPTAEQRPVTLNGGMRMNAWYDIVGLDDRASESCDGIEASVDRIKTILHNEKSLGLPYSRMMLAGFSQGGAMSLFTGLQLQLEIEGEADKPSLAGILVMSGYLPGASKFKLSEGFQHVPVVHLHGEADPVVRPQWARMTEQGLKSHGMTDYTLKFFSGVGHTISMDMVSDAMNFIQKSLPEDSAFVIKPKPPSEMSIKELKQAVRNLGLAHQAAGFYEKQEFVKLLEEYQANTL